VRSANYVVRFLLEPVMLVALGAWGYGVGAGLTAQVVVAIGARR
jgi:hypothetical protein